MIKDDDRTVLKSVLLEVRMPVTNLTEARIREIEPGSGIWRDEQVRGLMEVIGLREARRRARELMSQIQSGIDPTSKPDETSITLRQALEIHLSERTFRPSTE